jgi:uncharacterized membrane protein YGL010W
MRNWFYEQLAMYSAYHRDGRNQATHHIGVPMIVFSLIVLTTPVRFAVPGLEAPLSLASLLMGALLLLYVLSTPLIGVIAVMLYGALMFGAVLITAGEPMGFAVKLFATLFIVGWIIQFWGHTFEGRKPALFDNLVQIFIAPAFLIAEVLFTLGLEKGLKAEIEKRMPTYLPKAG